MNAEAPDYQRLRSEYRWRVPASYNIAADVCDARDPDSLAMVHEHHEGAVREVHWGELQALSNQAANLLAGLGVGEGDRVALVLPPTPETAALFFGTWKLGAILLSMSVLYGDEGIAHRIGDSEPKVLVTDAVNAPRFEGLEGPRVVVLDPSILAAESERCETAETFAEDPAQLYYTSGTTGLAKGIVHAHRYLLGHNEFVHCHEVEPGERFHGMGEWAWAAGICTMWVPCLAWLGQPRLQSELPLQPRTFTGNCSAFQPRRSQPRRKRRLLSLRRSSGMKSTPFSSA